MTCNILIAYHSRGGTVEALARAIAEGAAEAGAEVRVRRARELSEEAMARQPAWAEAAARMNAAHPAPSVEDAAWADGVILGSPTRFGSPAQELLAYLESLGALWIGNRLVDKAGAAFTSTATPHGGTETTLLSLYPPLAHLGFVIVPNGYGSPLGRVAGTPYGSSSNAQGAMKQAPSDNELEVARHQGRHVARVAAALRTMREAAAG